MKTFWKGGGIKLVIVEQVMNPLKPSQFKTFERKSVFSSKDKRAQESGVQIGPIIIVFKELNFVYSKLKPVFLF